MLRAVTSGLLVSTLAIGASVRADVVVTSGGSRLVGTIERMSEGKLMLATEFAGAVAIDASTITALGSDGPLNVELGSGDRMVGKIAETGTIQTSVGSVSLSTADIVAIWQPGAESPAELAMQESAETWKPNWTATIEAGGTRKEGNTDTLDAQGRFDMQRKTKSDLLSFYLAAEYSEQDDLRSQNEYRGGMSYENMFTERWFWYTRFDLEYDEFENLDIRATASVGAGYYWFKRDDFEWKNRFGVGYRHESFDTGDSRDEAVVDLGLDIRKDFAPWLQFTHSTTYSPSLEDFGVYRIDADTAVQLPLKNDVTSLKLGMRNEYNSSPIAGNERLDNTYYANIVLRLLRN